MFKKQKGENHFPLLRAPKLDCCLLIYFFSVKHVNSFHKEMAKRYIIPESKAAVKQNPI